MTPHAFNDRPLRHAAASMFVMALVGCGTPEPAATTSTSDNPAVSPTVVTALPSAPESAPEPEIPVPSISEVVGWTDQQINDVLGPASLVRQDLGAQIWRYSNDGCQLLVFLYEEAGRDIVRHLEADNGQDTAACLGTTVRAHHKKQTG